MDKVNGDIRSSRWPLYGVFEIYVHFISNEVFVIPQRKAVRSSKEISISAAKHSGVQTMALSVNAFARRL